ncbi:hypothetical protein [Alkanindiges illinoisensis]|uniref:hypothetical protein n=1 Tax=Alkanindiges illinoisensis TaxID=197183 RepID=UPI00146FBAE1|nr:hypothetical protein [Alkanindiges illinoisensis]
MAPSPVNTGYDLGLGALIAMFIVFYAPMVYIFMAIFRSQKDKPAPDDLAGSEK